MTSSSSFIGTSYLPPNCSINVQHAPPSLRKTKPFLRIIAIGLAALSLVAAAILHIYTLPPWFAVLAKAGFILSSIISWDLFVIGPSIQQKLERWIDYEQHEYLPELLTLLEEPWLASSLTEDLQNIARRTSYSKEVVLSSVLISDLERLKDVCEKYEKLGSKNSITTSILRKIKRLTNLELDESKTQDLGKELKQKTGELWDHFAYNKQFMQALKSVIVKRWLLQVAETLEEEYVNREPKVNLHKKNWYSLEEQAVLHIGRRFSDQKIKQRVDTYLKSTLQLQTRQAAAQKDTDEKIKTYIERQKQDFDSLVECLMEQEAYPVLLVGYIVKKLLIDKKDSKIFRAVFGSFQNEKISSSFKWTVLLGFYPIRNQLFKFILQRSLTTKAF